MDLAEVVPAVNAGSGRTLVAFDIDDTLLTSTTFYGSDYWYEWQKTLSPGDPGLVPCRFDVIALNYEAGTQELTQELGPQVLQSVPTDRLLLTSRNPVSRGATLRELRKAGYEMPPQIDNSADGILYAWKKGPTSKPVTVSYFDCVFMVSGQDKGVLLLDLLRRLEQH